MVLLYCQKCLTKNDKKELLEVKLKDERIAVRMPAELKQKVIEVAERYDLSMSNALLFLLDCGLDVEKDYRPVLVVTSKVLRFSEKVKKTKGKREVSK